MTDYVPVACELHSELELAIMRHQPLRLSWRGPDGRAYRETVAPTDLCSKNHEEFLHVRSSRGETLAIRLDRIVEFSRIDE